MCTTTSRPKQKGTEANNALNVFIHTDTMDAPDTPPRRPGRRQQASPQAKDPVIGKVIQLPTFEVSVEEGRQ